MEQETINKIKKMFKSCNFVTKYDIDRNNVAKEDFGQFLDHFKLTALYSSIYGTLVLKKDGELLDVEQIQAL